VVVSTTLHKLRGGHLKEPTFRGWVRRMKDGKILLIGDVNQLGGVCDDCVELDDCDEIEIIQELSSPS